MEYAQIDWHDFVIVETINFKESETGKDHRHQVHTGIYFIIVTGHHSSGVESRR